MGGFSHLDSCRRALYQHQWPVSGSSTCRQSARQRAMATRRRTCGPTGVSYTLRSFLVPRWCACARACRGARTSSSKTTKGCPCRSSRRSFLCCFGRSEVGGAVLPGCLSCDGPRSSATPHDFCPRRGRLRVWSYAWEASGKGCRWCAGFCTRLGGAGLESSQRLKRRLGRCPSALACVWERRRGRRAAQERQQTRADALHSVLHTIIREQPWSPSVEGCRVASIA